MTVHARFASRPTPSRRGQRGAVSIFMVGCIVLLIGVVGLALDSGLAYLIRAKLDAAADAAAIAAGEAVTTGDNQNEQTNNAVAAAKRFFAANYPSGYLGTTASLAEPDVEFNQGTITINTAATAVYRVSLMSFFGFNLMNISTSAQSVRRDLDMVFIVDTTGSLATNPTVPPAVRSAAVTFLNQFDPVTDRVSLIHFAYGTQVDVPFNGNARGFDRARMITDIMGDGTKQNPPLSFNGSTNSSEPYWNALDQLNRVITQPSSLRVIVFFSDGAPNSFAADFSSNPLATPPYNYSTGVPACDGVSTVTTPDESAVSLAGSKPGGFYQINGSDTPRTGCLVGDITNTVLKTGGTISVKALPPFYNAHPPQKWLSATAIPIVTNSGPRPVAAQPITALNVNNAARNIAESLASVVRSEGVYVFALGQGSELNKTYGLINEPGSNVLKCMANTTDAPARCANPSQPQGLYCSAVKASDITPCFSKLASEILRIAK